MAWRNIRAHVKQVLLRIVGYGIIYDKFEQAKQTLFVLPSVPSTLVAPSIPIPLVGIMDRIAELVVKVFSAPVIVVAKNASIATPTTNVGPLDQAKGDGGNVDTSLIEPTDMVTDSVANP